MAASGLARRDDLLDIAVVIFFGFDLRVGGIAAVHILVMLPHLVRDRHFLPHRQVVEALIRGYARRQVFVLDKAVHGVIFARVGTVHLEPALALIAVAVKFADVVVFDGRAGEVVEGHLPGLRLAVEHKMLALVADLVVFVVHHALQRLGVEGQLARRVAVGDDELPFFIAVHILHRVRGRELVCPVGRGDEAHDHVVPAVRYLAVGVFYGEILSINDVRIVLLRHFAGLHVQYVHGEHGRGHAVNVRIAEFKRADAARRLVEAEDAVLVARRP